jgi:hypothetical protein
MALKERSQNPVVGDDVKLRLFAYNSNNRADFNEISKVEIYFLDPAAISEDNLDGRTLVETIDAADVTTVETGQYMITVSLGESKYAIGKYIDVWYVTVELGDPEATVENVWQIYPDLWFTTPTVLVYDFNFSFRPNKIRKGSKRFIVIDITPNVPKASDMARYYENLAIVSPLKISIEQECGNCVPAEEDLRLVVDQADVELRDKSLGYYFIDTTDWAEGVYNVWFEMIFGESTFISDKLQLQIF